MLKIILLFTLISAVLPSNHIYAVQKQEENDFIFAQKALSDGFYDLAEEKLYSLLKTYPDSTYKYKAHLLLGRTFYHRDKFKKAIYEFGLVLEDPEGVEFIDEALYWQGEVYFKLKDHKNAMKFYQRLIDEYPESRYRPYCYYSIAWSYYELGKHRMAI
ncbi:MAG: tetratricopeptide repeat protein, partial [Candidatus Omnitrophica bacterium]|nr:tetratricopeptide repeat protein [Candidatus Omnitrophota bacterium]